MEAVQNASAREEILEQLGLTLDPDSRQGICIYSLNEQGAITAEYVSTVCAELLGLDKDLQCPFSVKELPLPDKALAEYERQLRQAFASKKLFQSSQSIEKAEGGRMWRRVDVKPLEKDGKLYLIELSTDDSKAQHFREEMAELKLRLQLSLEQTAQKLWELDINTGEFRVIEPNEADGSRRVTCTMLFPDEMLQKGWIHPDSIASFRLFSRKLLGGEHRGGAAFMMRSLSGSGFTWYALSFRMIFDDENIPVKAVGILSSLDPSSTAPRFALYSRLWEYLLPSLYCYICFNISQDRLEQLWQTGKNLTNRGIHDL